jgi:hypothetical protein
MPRAKAKQRAGPPLKPISNQMREWSTMLEGEVVTWPNVTAKKMFGMKSLYRGKRIFAALPLTRALISEDTLIFKLEKPSKAVAPRLKSDMRIIEEFGIGTRWYGFRITSNEDLHDAIEWLAIAYEAAGKKAA